MKKGFLVAMIISLVISALVGIGIFLFGHFGELEGKILLTTLLIGLYCLTGLCCSLPYEKGKFKVLSIIGVVSSCVAIIFELSWVWAFISDSSDTVGKLVLTGFIVSPILAHICLMLLTKPKTMSVAVILWLTVSMISILGSMLLYLVYFADLFSLNNLDFFFRMLGVVAILVVAGTIITPILNKVVSLKKS